jgi:CubicO group peptidase (beta-lactamase class C family)
LGRKTVELMRVNHLAGIGDGESFWPGVGFAFGYAVLFDLGRYGDLGSVGEMWWAGSTNVNYWWGPREELVGIFATHTLPFGHLGGMSAVKRLTYQALTI